MATTKLNDARDYFEQVLTPSYEEFFTSPSTFHTAYGMAASLYHLHEWLWHYNKADIKRKFGPSVSTKGQFWHQVVEKNAKDSGFIRDLNNAAKHVKLDIRKSTPSTQMHHSANTHITTSSFSVDSYGTRRYSGGSIEMAEGRRTVSLDTVAKTLHRFWEGLVNEFYPQPSQTITLVAGPATANS